MQKGSRQLPASGCQFSIRGLQSRRKPFQEAVFEFPWGCAYRSAVIGVGDFPENCIFVVGFDFLRVAQGDVAVDLAVD